MAALPKKKISKVRGKTRRAGSLRWSRPSFIKCAKCGALKLPHQVCENCGYFGELKVITTASEKKVATFLKRQKKEEARKKRAKGKELKTKSKERKVEASTKPKVQQATPKEKKAFLQQALEKKQKAPRRSFFDIFRRKRPE